MSVSIKRVLISDNVDKKCDDLLQAHGIEVITKCALSTSDLIKTLVGCDGLIVRSDTKVTKEVIEAAKSLKVIGRAGTGVDNIDTEAATRAGIIVLNAPNGNSISACELTCSLISCLARNVTSGCQSMKEGRWDRKAFAGGSELMGKTLAIIGLGRIGKEVAGRMKSFGMQIVGYDPFVTNEDADRHGIELLQLEQIWPVADYITVHTPLIPQTKNLINKSVFAKCVRGVKIMNVARGGIVDEADLLQALEDGICAGAALDVFSEEPPKSELLRKLISHPRVIATPHLGASTDEAQTRVAIEVAQQFISLNDLTSDYQITGVLNAPALLASRQSQNTAWLCLSEQLGRILSRILRSDDGGSLHGAIVNISLAGPDIRNMKFLSTSVLLGLLSGNVENGYNLINSPMYAKEAGFKILFENEECMEVEEEDFGNTIRVTVRNEILPLFSIRGTVSDGIPYLLQLNDVKFALGSVLLTETLQIYSTEPSNVKDAINTVMSWNEKIHNLSIGYGKIAWIIVRGEVKKKLSTVPSIRQY